MEQEGTTENDIDVDLCHRSHIVESMKVCVG